jgi:glycosyltransferase involved in cell wall biosynthesis
MRIAIVGPVYPLRGGISHSNTLLCENLVKRHTVLPFSFRRLYPSFLFPGKSQLYEGTRKLAFKTDFCIDSINPITWLTTIYRIRKFRPKLLILQWWTPFLTPVSYALLSLIRLTSDIKIVIICANVTQHENKIGSMADKMLTLSVFRIADYFITLAEGDLRKLKQWYPEAKAKVLIEPTFDSVFNLGSVTKEQARKRLKLRERTILFFGFVRDYKGLGYLLEAMPAIRRHCDVDLVIAGEFWGDKQKYLDQIARLKIQSSVKMVDSYIPDEEVAPYFHAADLVILPYTDASQSGIIQIAIGALTPVISTNVGAIDDFVDDGKTGYIVPPKDPAAIAQAVIRVYRERKEKTFRENLKEKKKVFAWNKKKEDVLFFGLNEKR